MKFLFGLAIGAAIGVATAENLNDARCLVLTPGQQMGCNKYQVTKDDVEGCGSKNKPCPTNGGFCGKCYRIDYSRADLTDSAKCTDGVCPGYDATVYVKTTGMTGTPDVFGVSQGAWSTLCPYICQGGSPVCVESPDQCKSGSPPEKEILGGDGTLYKFPSSCDAGEKRMTITELPSCEEEKEEDLPLFPLQCSVMEVGQESKCGQEPTYIVSNDFADDCGDTEERPCFARGLPQDCGKCFKLTFTDPEKKSGDCAGGKCPAHVGEAYVMVTEVGGQMTVPQGAARSLCPALCTGKQEICVSDEESCLAPIADRDMGLYTFPAACYKGKYEVTKEEIACNLSSQPEIKS